MIVQPSEVAPQVRPGGRLTADEQLTLASVLEDIEAEAVAIIKSDFGPISYTDEVASSDDPYPWSGQPLRLFLNHRPIISVSSVKVDGVELEADAWSFDVDSLVIYERTNSLTLTPPYRYTATVTYTAGIVDEMRRRAAAGPIKRRTVRILSKITDEALGTSTVSAEHGYRAIYLAEGWLEEELTILQEVGSSGTAVASSPITSGPERSWFER